jgi:hypothetical protein
MRKEVQTLPRCQKPGCLGFGVECGSALLCRFCFSFGFSLWAVCAAAKQEKPKRRSKAPPHSTPKGQTAKTKPVDIRPSLRTGQ